MFIRCSELTTGFIQQELIPDFRSGLSAGTLGVSLAGFGFASKLSARLGKRREIAGGAILCLIGLRILASPLGL
jgi:putative Mn2+ efflux pump MntP